MLEKVNQLFDWFVEFTGIVLVRTRQG